MDTNRRAWQEWVDQLRSADALDRCEAAETPPESAEPHDVVEAVLPLLHDAHELVRLAAAETLGLYPDSAGTTALRAYVRSEKVALARAHGLSSLGLVGEELDIAYLLSVVTDETNEDIEQIHGVLGLYELVRRTAVRRLKNHMKSETMATRTGASGALALLVSRRYVDEIIEALQQQLEKEETVNGRESLKKYLDSILPEGP